MTEKIRLNLSLAPELHASMQAMADESGTTMTDVFRTAFALYKVCHEARKSGQYIGVVNDRKKLDREFVGLI